MATRVAIRSAYPSDLQWVKQSMVGTLRDNSAFCKGIHPATMEALIDPVLATYQVLMAVDADDTDSTLGFIVYRDATTVAFVYVRSQFRSKVDPATGRRRGGIGRALLAHAGIARATGTCARPGCAGNSHTRDCPAFIPEIACAFMVTKLDGETRGQAFGALAERKGYRLRFRPYLPLEITARVLHGAAGQDAE